jgi:hypothetical protein
MDCVEQHQTQDLAEPGDGLEQRQGLGLVLFGRFEDGALSSAEELGIVPEQGESHCHALLDRESGEPLGDARTVGFLRELLPALWEIVLAVRGRTVGQQLSALARQISPAPVPRGTHGGRRDVGLGEPATTEQGSDFLCINRVVFGFATVNGLHVQGMAEDKRDILLGTQIGEPGPGKNTLHRDHHILPRGCKGLEKRLWARLHVPVQQELAILCEDAHIHGAGRQVEATVCFVLFRVKAPEVSSS